MSTRPANYVGDLILGYDDGEYEEEYSARVTGATIIDNNWVIHFSGIDSELGPYVGDMHLELSGKIVKGQGTFRFAGEAIVTSTVSAKVTRKNKSTVTCEGTWLELGDATPYEMVLDLISSRPKKINRNDLI